MSTNYLTAAITAYEALSEAEKDLFYKVIYRSEISDCCSAEEPEETQVENKPEVDMHKALKEYLDKVKNLPNISKPSPWDYTRIANPYEPAINFPTFSIALDSNGLVAGYGLIADDFRTE